MSTDRRTFLRQLVIGGASVSALTACGGEGSSNESSQPPSGPDLPEVPNPETPDTGTPEPENATESLSFIVIGDMGTGNIGQYHVAEAMRKIAMSHVPYRSNGKHGGGTNHCVRGGR